MKETLDCVAYLTRSCQPRAGIAHSRHSIWYGPHEADPAAIANLERLQRERPLKPPGANNE